MLQQLLTNLIERSRATMKSLPVFFHFILFITAIMIAILSINFEVFRVMRIGDLFILIFAFLVGVNWYGQRMQEEGYRNGLRKATESTKSKRK